MIRLFRILAAIFLFSVILNAQSTLIAIQGARVIDGTGAPARKVTVLIRDDRIVAVGEQVAIPPAARIIDARGDTLLPGLFDLHTHIHSSGVPRFDADWGKDLKAYLACGVTTINDFSSYGEMFAPIRKLIRDGTVLSPRLNLAVRISSPAGHGTESGWGRVFTLRAATPAQAHAAMREALAYKPDVIKVFTDGWRYNVEPNLTNMNEETLAAIVTDAHAAGIRVFTHTVTLEGAKIAARAGVDVIAHGVGNAPIDDELSRLMKEHGTMYVSTLAVFEPRQPHAPDQKLLSVLEPAVRLDAKRFEENVPVPQPGGPDEQRWHFLQENIRCLHAAGIPIAVGTDAGMPDTYHGWATLHEIELLVDSGLTPLEALTAATGVSARALGVEKDRGTIQPGMTADLVLVKGDPDRNIAAIEHTDRVFLGGKELNIQALQAAIQDKAMTPLPSQTLPALVDDMERADGRSDLDTRLLDRTDLGIDHSRILFARVERQTSGHALMLLGHMGPKKYPYVRVELPLTRGAIDPGDVSKFKGVSFDVRGQGQFQLLIENYDVRNFQWYGAPFEAGAKWHAVRIPFSELRSKSALNPAWDSHDVQSMLLQSAGEAGSDTWLEIDNIRFYQ